MKLDRSTLLACALCFAAGACATLAGRAVTGATRREPQFENEHVRVWKSIIMPNQQGLAQHRHEHGRALIALTDGEVDVVGADGAKLEHYRWERGKAYWLDADPPVRTHADVSTVKEPIEVIVVELKKDR